MCEGDIHDIDPTNTEQLRVTELNDTWTSMT